MGSLKKGAAYIYEKEDGILYSREYGESTHHRKEIGWDFDPRTSDGRPLNDYIMEDILWREIRQAAKENPALFSAIERVKTMYYLSNQCK
jgi:hypothetical protein